MLNISRSAMFRQPPKNLIASLLQIVFRRRPRGVVQVYEAVAEMIYSARQVWFAPFGGNPKKQVSLMADYLGSEI